jgi:hypothetical protein
MYDEDVAVFTTWFLNDRELPDGTTPAERYVARHDLPDAEREVAARIASARLGVYRVLAVEPGRSLVLEDVLGGGRTTAASDQVSGEAVRWDLIVCRVMSGEPVSLWGPVRVVEPADEPDLRAELERLAGGRGPYGDAELARALRDHAVDVLRWRPPSWDVEPTCFTLEGHPVAEASATWRVHDVRAATERMRAFGGLARGEPLEIDITVRRDLLVAERGELPRGAVVIEAVPVDDQDNVPVASVRLERERLRIETMSAERLERAIEIIELDFGDVAQLVERVVAPIGEQRTERRSQGRRPEAKRRRARAGSEERRLVDDLMTAHMRRWLDEPHPGLGGVTPRQAAMHERRDDVVRLLRHVENSADRARRRGEPFADVTWMRGELGLEDELAA